MTDAEILACNGPEDDCLITAPDADLIAFGRACVLAERERCAALCERISANYTRHYKIGANECAAAIRGQP
jgi:hypothetical protein